MQGYAIFKLITSLQCRNMLNKILIIFKIRVSPNWKLRKPQFLKMNIFPEVLEENLIVPKNELNARKTFFFQAKYILQNEGVPK